MSLFLPQRDVKSSEHMDDPDCGQTKLENTYRQFSRINSLVSQWHKIYNEMILPVARAKKSTTILDIGFGGGDIPIKLARWSTQDDANVQITAIDPDKRANAFVQTLDYPDNATFIQQSIADFKSENLRFDFVISNHLIHHLSPTDFDEILKKSKSLSRQAVIFNDIRRSGLAYMLFNLSTRPFFYNSFITEDGLTSIKRSYTFKELAEVVPDNWQVQKIFPFRLLLTYKHE